MWRGSSDTDHLSRLKGRYNHSAQHSTYIRAWQCVRVMVVLPSIPQPPLSSYLSVLVAVPPGVFQVLARTFVAVRVQIDGAGRSLGQELCPDVLCPLCHFLLRHPLQVLHGQPEPAGVPNNGSSEGLTERSMCQSTESICQLSMNEHFHSRFSNSHTVVRILADIHRRGRL